MSQLRTVTKQSHLALLFSQKKKNNLDVIRVLLQNNIIFLIIYKMDYKKKIMIIMKG